jgi:hypothetical protein
MAIEPYDRQVENDLADFPLRLVCGWCKQVMRDLPGPESTGICPDCLAKIKSETNWDAIKKLFAPKGAA